MKIESHDSDIESLLDTGYFYIPRFQRPYSWEEDNINDFWEDVVTNTSPDYFIGSMVVFKKDKQRFGVVDGQQRLTTITILLCVLRDKFLELGIEDLAKGIHQLVERKNRNNKLEYVLQTETSFPYFQEHIQKFDEEADADGNAAPEETYLLNAHAKFQSLVDGSMAAIDLDPSLSKSVKKTRKRKKLVLLRDAVFNLKIILVSLDEEDDAYIIFETLNTRGKDLALTDLVKNHFSKHLKAPGAVDHTNIKWTKILETIHNSSEDISTDNYIYHFWASRYESIPQKKLFGKFKKAVTKGKAKEYLNDLLTDAETYRSLYETSYAWKKPETEAARSLNAMQIFKLSQPIPATLALARAYKKKKIKYARFRDALVAIENFHFQFTAVTSSRSSGGISAMYSSFGQKLFASTTPQGAANEIDALKEKLRERVPSLEEFTVAFSEITYTNSNSKQKNLVRYILRKFSEYYDYKYSCDYEELTVEHFYPQSKIDAVWTDNVVGSLGNLFFLEEIHNGKIDTKSPPEKKKYLKKNECAVPKFIGKSRGWTPDLVKTHTELMAREAWQKVWKI
ncbi:DUF262 domain-containing HNH endonuclease family protein [Congregibacter brevis]|uniref:DUF262 domain-containing HNH endonuclease family protein n=1 Tax=Congregibacter brevis TaxID=3081201 RepID=A0ABZ0IG57_9GAMM|nr:DUF262 domain-containing HNH endonuclease family protein [Congregibacter sp. IMCC45268]